jgi:2'-5' RNA ligase
VFSFPAFIVLDLPAGIAGDVATLRRKADPNFPPLPAEITVTGSSGVGPLYPDQSIDSVFRSFDTVAAQAGGIETAFCAIGRFAGSPILYLEPRDAAPFKALHDSLRASGIRFGPSPYPYTPHCTIRSHGAGCPDSSELVRVLSLPFPMQCFRLDTLSLYEIDSEKRECRLLRRRQLR